MAGMANFERLAQIEFATDDKKNHTGDSEDTNQRVKVAARHF